MVRLVSTDNNIAVPLISMSITCNQELMNLYAYCHSSHPLLKEEMGEGVKELPRIPNKVA